RKLGNNAKNIINKMKLISSLSSKQTMLKTKINKERELKNLLNEMLLPNFINKCLKVVDNVFPGQPNDSFETLLKTLKQSHLIPEIISLIFSNDTISLFAGTIFIYQSENIFNIIKISMACVILTNFKREET
uniref:Uncharacterized protein n=1 Tax=Strongyloides stercoralis TaxID=6248 RepID=A0AAF5DLW1_STRER